jgi:hypothetical protein
MSDRRMADEADDGSMITKIRREADIGQIRENEKHNKR